MLSENTMFLLRDERQFGYIARMAVDALLSLTPTLLFFYFLSEVIEGFMVKISLFQN